MITGLLNAKRNPISSIKSTVQILHGAFFMLRQVTGKLKMATVSTKEMVVFYYYERRSQHEDRLETQADKPEVLGGGCGLYYPYPAGFWRGRHCRYSGNGIIMAGGTLVAYIIAEGLTDAASAGSSGSDSKDT